MPKILVIDDDEQYRTLVLRMLQGEEYRVFDASSAEEGYDIFLNEDPDLVITDILMPQTDGIELITRLRRTKPDLPIIAISGGGKCAAELYLSSSKYLGATQTLPKPFYRDDLLHAVKEALSPCPRESV